jgi:hypothetical protein
MGTFTHVTFTENLLKLHQSQLSSCASCSNNGAVSTVGARLALRHGAPCTPIGTTVACRRLLAVGCWDSNSEVFSRWRARPIELCNTCHRQEPADCCTLPRNSLEPGLLVYFVMLATVLEQPMKGPLAII